jgi:hypothetical protein
MTEHCEHDNEGTNCRRMGGMQISQKDFDLALLCWWTSNKWCH